MRNTQHNQARRTRRYQAKNWRQVLILALRTREEILDEVMA